MNEQEFQGWQITCKKEIVAQIILNRIKKLKLIKREKEKKIQNKINLLGYSNFLKSPHLEGKEDLKKKAIILCLHDYRSSIGFAK